MAKQLFSILIWLISLFNPPALASLTVAQKVGRILAVSLSLVAMCFLSAMAVASGIFIMERACRELSASPELLRGLGIVVAGICVNSICWMVLLEIRRADLKLHLACWQGEAA